MFFMTFVVVVFRMLTWAKIVNDSKKLLAKKKNPEQKQGNFVDIYAPRHFKGKKEIRSFETARNKPY